MAKLAPTAEMRRKAALTLDASQTILRPNLLARAIHKNPQFRLRRRAESSKSFQEPKTNWTPQAAALLKRKNRPVRPGRLLIYDKIGCGDRL